VVYKVRIGTTTTCLQAAFVSEHTVWFAAFLGACFQLQADNDSYLEIVFYFQALFASKVPLRFSKNVLLIRNIHYCLFMETG
jgi:hypothetical protein